MDLQEKIRSNSALIILLGNTDLCEKVVAIARCQEIFCGLDFAAIGQLIKKSSIDREVTAFQYDRVLGK